MSVPQEHVCHAKIFYVIEVKPRVEISWAVLRNHFVIGKTWQSLYYKWHWHLHAYMLAFELELGISNVK